ncbi:tumor necrosis factor receptor superfamily member 26-like [Sylvia atricapilla]|uniref:tumor necrosis factor receptor superfamily member 26-like n=1 Tax=Sylvia atricapilla TaxID=48155 RepID=UPI003394591F
MGRVVGLLLVVLLTLPGARAECGEREYFHEGFCCEFCEAGTFVADHCNTSHSRGKCDPCKEGKGFTAHANGLEECLPCRQCKEGQVTLRPCTRTQDAECQCKPGYSRPHKDHEICQRNSQMHPDGKEIAPNSTATTDPALPSQGKEAFDWVIPLIVVMTVAVLICLCFLIVKKLKRNRAASTDEEGGWISGRMCRCDATSCDSYKVHKSLNYVKHPGVFVELCLPSHPGQICSTSSVYKS